MTEQKHDEENQKETEEVGIPKHFRIKRTYNRKNPELSEAELEQRRNAANSPNKSEGMQWVVSPFFRKIRKS